MSYNGAHKPGQTEASTNGNLYRNSLYIFSTAIIGSVIGFAFWVVAARSYSMSEVGIASVSVSAIYLLTALSRFGFDQSILRFFPVGEKGKIMFTSLFVTSIASLAFGVIFLIGLNVWGKGLEYLKDVGSALTFLSILFLYSTAMLIGTSFLANRRGDHYFLLNMVIHSRIVMLIPLAAFGALGIIDSLGIGLLAALVLSVFLLTRQGIHSFKIDLSFVRNSIHFLLSNYAVGLFGTVPILIIPIIVLNAIGPNAAAIYYIVYAIFSVLYMVPGAIGTSLLVEGSHGEELRRTATKSIRASMIVIAILMTLIFVFGKFVLGLVGSNYVDGYELLVMISLSTFFIAIQATYYSIKMVQKEMRILIYLSAFFSILLISSSYLLIGVFGLTGIGYSFLLSYGSLALITCILAKRENWFSTIVGFKSGGVLNK